MVLDYVLCVSTLHVTIWSRIPLSVQILIKRDRLGVCFAWTACCENIFPPGQPSLRIESPSVFVHYSFVLRGDKPRHIFSTPLHVGIAKEESRRVHGSQYIARLVMVDMRELICRTVTKGKMTKTA